MGDALDDVFGGGQGSGASDMASGYQNAIGTYEDYLNKITELYQPYMQSGKLAGGKMQNQGGMQERQYRQMMGQGPGGTGDWQTQYTASPWADYQTDIGTQSADASAAASGMLGSGTNQRATATMSEDIASKDRQQYYDDMMGLGAAASSNWKPLQASGASFAKDLGQYTYGTGGEIAGAQEGKAAADAMGDAANASMWGNIINMGMYGPGGSPGQYFGGTTGASGVSGGGQQKGSGGGGGIMSAIGSLFV